MGRLCFCVSKFRILSWIFSGFYMFFACSGPVLPVSDLFYLFRSCFGPASPVSVSSQLMGRLCFCVPKFRILVWIVSGFYRFFACPGPVLPVPDLFYLFRTCFTCFGPVSPVSVSSQLMGRLFYKRIRGGINKEKRKRR